MRNTLRRAGFAGFIAIVLLGLFGTALAYTTYTDVGDVSIASYDSFRSSVLGNAYDLDGAYGAQCFDGAGVLWRKLGRWLQSGGDNARGTWLVESARLQNKGTEFELITNLNDVRRGDVVVLNNSSYGHIGFADEDYTGQVGTGSWATGKPILRMLHQNVTYNGVKHSEFIVCNTEVSTFVGAFRFKGWWDGMVYQKPVFWVTGQTEDTITFSWNAVPNANHYDLYAYKGDQIATTCGYILSVATGTSVTVRYSDLNVDPGLDVYSFTLAVVGDDPGNWIFSDQLLVYLKTHINEKPVPRITAQTEDTVTLEWDPVLNASYYDVYAYKGDQTATTCGYVLKATTGTSVTLSYSQLNIDQFGGEYSFTVAAVAESKHYLFSNKIVKKLGYEVVGEKFVLEMQAREGVSTGFYYYKKPYMEAETICGVSAREHKTFNYIIRNMRGELWFVTQSGGFAPAEYFEYLYTDAESASLTDVDIMLAVQESDTYPLVDNFIPLTVWADGNRYQPGDRVHACGHFTDRTGNGWYILDNGSYIPDAIVIDAGSAEIIWPTGIEVTPGTVNCCSKTSVKLSAAVSPENATYTDVTWSSGNPEVCSVNEYGEISCIKAGTAVITATTRNGISDTCTVTVTDPEAYTEASLDAPNPLSIKTGSDKTIDVCVKPGSAAFIASGDSFDCWTSNSEVAQAAAAISGNRLTVEVTPIAPGRTVLYVSVGNLDIIQTVIDVYDDNTLTVDGFRTIGAEAFAGTKASTLLLYSGEIRSRAFAGSASLNTVIIGSRVSSIAADAFEGCGDITIYGDPGSYAEDYAEAAGFYFIPSYGYEPVLSDWVTESELPEGAKVYLTKVVYRYRDTVPTIKYSAWSDWNYYREARETITDANLMQEQSSQCYWWYFYVCNACGAHNRSYGSSACRSCGGSVSYVYHAALLPNTKGTGEINCGGSIYFYNNNDNAKGSVTAYRYRTRTASTVMVTGDWSDWLDDEPLEAEGREIENAGLYKYIIR